LKAKVAATDLAGIHLLQERMEANPSLSGADQDEEIKYIIPATSRHVKTLIM
jgi:hypothetical protein